MKPLLALCATCFATTVLARPVNSASIEDAKAFLARYVSQSHLQSPQFLDLYSDRALIRMRIEGASEPRAFEGRLYKHWVREALQSGKTALDAAQFSDAIVERRGARLVIRAKRYSLNRCYWDAGYVVGLEREGGRWVIVEEQLVTQPRARCAGVASAPPAAAPSALSFSSSTSLAVLPGPPSAARVAPALAARSSLSVQAPMPMPGTPRPSATAYLPNMQPASVVVTPSK